MGKKTFYIILILCISIFTVYTDVFTLLFLDYTCVYVYVYIIIYIPYIYICYRQYRGCLDVFEDVQCIYTYMYLHSTLYGLMLVS